MSKKRTLILFFLCMALTSSLSFSDTVVLKNGTKFDVEKVWEEGGRYKCKRFGAVVSYPKEAVLKVIIVENKEKPTESEFRIWEGSILKLTDDKRRQYAGEQGISTEKLNEIIEKCNDYLEKTPTSQEIAIYEKINAELWKDTKVPEKEVMVKLSRKLNMEVYELDMIFIKVVTYKGGP